MPGVMRWLVAVGLVLSLGACSTVKGWFEMDDEDPKAPAKLEDIQQTVKIKKLWSHGVGDGQGDGFYKIQPRVSGDMIYAAAADGDMIAVNRLTGKVAWEAETELPLSGGVGVYGDALLLGSSDGHVLKVFRRDGVQAVLPVFIRVVGVGQVADLVRHIVRYVLDLAQKFFLIEVGVQHDADISVDLRKVFALEFVPVAIRVNGQDRDAQDCLTGILGVVRGVVSH